jgi:hypothetical protein
MAPRRKSPRRRAKRTFVISAIEGGAALSLMQSTGAATAVQQALKGDIVGGVNTLSSNIQSQKSKIIGTLAAAGTAKVLAKSFRVGNVAKLGPLVVRI